ncbi:MAG: hypothetical protein ACI4IL_05100 [Eubacterium sp.]
MSDKGLSIDEIIQRAEQIKAQAEAELRSAEKSLDEKARLARDEVKVDTQAVMQKIEELTAEEEDVKEFTPSAKGNDKTQPVKLNFNKEKEKRIRGLSDDDFTKEITLQESDEDMKIVDENDEDIFEDSLFPYEKTRPVVISTDSRVNEDSDLQEIPTIMSSRQVKSFDNIQEDFDEETGVQLSFDGFDDVIEKVPSIDEKEAEKQLFEQRREKVNKFRLFGPDETDKELGDKSFAGKDYKDVHDGNDILNNLLSRKHNIHLQLAFTGLITVLLLLLTIFKDSGVLPNVLSSNSVYFAVSLALVVVCLIANYNVILHGLNLKKGINSDFPVTILSAIIVAQNIGFLLNGDLWLDNGVLLSAALSFALIMSQLGKRQLMVRVIDNFDFIVNSENKYTVENIANTVDAEIISRGHLEDEDPIIKTSVKTDFPTNFMEISCKNEPADRLAKYLSPITVLLSIILLVVVGIMDNFNTGINMAVCALTIASPIATLFFTNNLLSDVSAELDKFASRVCGYEGAVMASNANAMVMEAADLFGKQSCDLLGIKVFNKTKVDDAIIYTAAVIIQTKSPLAHVFDDVIIGKQDILPTVENVTYEDKMGTSAWVYGHKVLVGNRELLIHHGVNVPKESFEQKFTRKNRKALYLAIDGKIKAMFVVSYSADPDMKRELKKLEKSGITIIVRSCDPYINEESLTNLFSLPKGYIRVMNYPAAMVYKKYSDLNVEKSPAYIVHNGTAKGFVSAMRASGLIISSKRLINFLVSFGSAFGFATVALFALIQGYGQITCTAIIGFQVIWNIFVLIITKLKRIGF